MENIVVQGRQKGSVGSRTVYQGMARWINQAALIRVQHFKCRSQVVGKDREEVEEQGRSVIWEECQDNRCCVVFVNPNTSISQSNRICA